MEAKTVFISVLILSLVTTQIQVEAAVCCEIQCGNLSTDVCAKTAGCRLPIAGICPAFLGNSGAAIKPLENKKGAAINELCKLGCASSMCNAISTLQISADASEEVVYEAVAQCKNACSAFCIMGTTHEIA